MAVVARDERAGERASLFSAVAAYRHILLLAVAVGGTLALQLTTIGYYFYFDDYVPFAEMVERGWWEYTWRLWASMDVTPNWRPLPGMLYLASWQIAGMDPLPVRIAMLAMHAGTVAMLYYVIWRTTGAAWAACAGALAFGLNPAYVGALSQVTTATQVMSVFFMVATLIAVIECCRTDDAARSRLWLAAATLLHILAIMSHEGMAIIFPAYALALLLFDREPDLRRRFARAAWCTAPLAAISFATAIAFTACGCNEAESVWGTEFVEEQTVIYLGRMLYPVGLELPTEIGTAHGIAAPLLLAIMALTAMRGPRIGMVGSAWVLLAIAPHVFIEYVTASRYLYLAAPGFAMLFASTAIMVVDWVRARGWPARGDALAVAGVALVAALFGWYAYQTVRQDDHFADTTAQWRRFHEDVTRVYPEVPPGARVEIIGGPFQKADYQYYILPAFAVTTWGPGRSLQDWEPGSLPAEIALASDNPYVAEYRDGELVPLR